MAGFKLPELIRPPALTPDEEMEQLNSHRSFLENAENLYDEIKSNGSKCPEANINDFQIQGRVGSGGYGVIYVATHLGGEELYAVKVQLKKGLSDMKLSVAVAEKRTLAAMNCEFVVKLQFAFQDAKNLYLAMQYAAVGDLFRFIYVNFSEDVLKFFAAQIILGIEYMHACRVIHKDIKLNNILVFPDNYLKIADMGFAEKCLERLFCRRGTFVYMAPERLKYGYGTAVDWWALGIMIYELKYKNHPFCKGPMNKNQIAAAIMNKPVVFPKNVSADLPICCLINGLLEKRPTERLGCRSVEDIKNNAWFKDISFIDVWSKRITLSVDLSDVMPFRIEPFATYDFLPAPEDVDEQPERFKQFC